MKKFLKNFDKLVSICQILRSEKGCIWDKKQTHESLVKYLFLEVEEVKQAVNNKDMTNLEEELGDVLFQIVFNAQIAKENKDFDIACVIEKLNEKLVRKHPHIFSNYKIKNMEDIEIMWENIKKKEKAMMKDIKLKVI
jgi:tetrapyrrole methylase family protein/MazG family protein